MRYFKVEETDDNGRPTELVGYFNSVISINADEFRREFAIMKGWEPEFGDINWYVFREVSIEVIENKLEEARGTVSELEELLK